MWYLIYSDAKKIKSPVQIMRLANLLKCFNKKNLESFVYKQ